MDFREVKRVPIVADLNVEQEKTDDKKLILQQMRPFMKKSELIGGVMNNEEAS